MIQQGWGLHGLYWRSSPASAPVHRRCRSLCPTSSAREVAPSVSTPCGAACVLPVQHRQSHPTGLL